MSTQQNIPIAITAPAPTASLTSSQKTEVAESEFSTDHNNDQNAWAEWRLNQRAPHYHLFPVASRYPHTTYFPSGSPATEPTITHHRPASESTIHESRSSCCTMPGWNLHVHSSPSRMSHIQGTICVVLAVALIFIVVLVLALVSSKEKP
ncbi:hypothetical protein F4823DRAFT_559642 [Ustulina deusta]|nr:hypothetical protein F4823DRAFT_559642 [Ustulina deusta]